MRRRASTQSVASSSSGSNSAVYSMSGPSFGPIMIAKFRTLRMSLPSVLEVIDAGVTIANHVPEAGLEGRVVHGSEEVEVDGTALVELANGAVQKRPVLALELVVGRLLDAVDKAD